MNPAFAKTSYVNESEIPQNLNPPSPVQSPPPQFQTIYPPVQPMSQVQYAPVQQPQVQYAEQAKQEYSTQQQFQTQGTQYRQATPIPSVGMSSVPVDCPSCGQRRMTNISYHAGNTTHVWGGVLCLLTGFLCFIPYLMNSLKDVQHRCSNCGLLLATWHKSGQVEVHAHA